MLAEGAEGLELAEALSTFEEQGFARLGSVLAKDGARGLRERANALMLGRVRYPGLFFQHDSATGRYEDLDFGAGWVRPSLSYRKLEKLELDPLFSAWIQNPLFGRIATAWLGGGVALYRAVLWNKASQAGMDLPWHQDDGVFWGLDRPPSLQIWTALDDAPSDAGCLEVVPGSHRRGLASPAGGTIPPDRLAERRPTSSSTLLPVSAGEAILIHNHLWHRSGRNSTPYARRAVGISYLSAATRCTRKRRAPREFKRLFAESPL
jgi:hypothetical protein